VNDNLLANSLSCYLAIQAQAFPRHSWICSFVNSCSYSLLSWQVGELVAVRGRHVAVEMGQLVAVRGRHIAVEAGQLVAVRGRHVAVEVGQLVAVRGRHIGVEVANHFLMGWAVDDGRVVGDSEASEDRVDGGGLLRRELRAG
jgi:hypothetical protein